MIHLVRRFHEFHHPPFSSAVCNLPSIHYLMSSVRCPSCFPWYRLTDIVLLGLGRRRVTKRYSSCSCSWKQFFKNPQGFLNTQRSATKLCTYKVGQKTGPLCSSEILLRSARFFCRNQSRLILNTKTKFTKINYAQQWRHLANKSHYFKWRSAALLLIVMNYCRASFEIMTRIRQMVQTVCK